LGDAVEKAISGTGVVGLLFKACMTMVCYVTAVIVCLVTVYATTTLAGKL